MFFIFITRHSLVRAKGEVFVLLLLFCSFFLSTISRQPRASSRQILHAGVLWFRMCLLPFWGLAPPPAGGKRGKWIFCYYGSQWGISAFWRFLSDISATLARIHTKYYLCRDSVCRRAPLPLWCPSAPGGVGGGVKNLKKNWGVVSFVHRTATISVFLSDAKCSPICTAQTCAHSGLEPSRSAKAFLQGGPKSSKKVTIFHHFETLRPYISETIKNRGI